MDDQSQLDGNGCSIRGGWDHSPDPFEPMVDILECDATWMDGSKIKYEVWWYKEKACWCLGPPCTLTTNNWSSLKIVGNVYENQDLLKEV